MGRQGNYILYPMSLYSFSKSECSLLPVHDDHRVKHHLHCLVSIFWSAASSLFLQGLVLALSHQLCVYLMQNALKNMEDECTHLQMMYQSSQEELEQLVERSEENIQEIRELNDKLQVHFTVLHCSLLSSHFLVL